MGSSVRLALLLLSTRHTFLRLLVVPTLFALFVLAAELTVLISFQSVFSPRSTDILSRNFEEHRADDIRWRLLYGEARTLGPLEVCIETTPDSECAQSLPSIAVHSDNPESVDIQRWRSLFEGSLDRIAVCRACPADVTIKVDLVPPQVTTHSMRGALLLGVILMDRALYQDSLALLERYFLHGQQLGNRVIRLPESNQTKPYLNLLLPLGLGVHLAFCAICIAMVIVWAHRKVLDYFVSSGVLLPLVAHCSLPTFYRALWMISALRSIVFLSVLIPLNMLIIDISIDALTLDTLLWGCALLGSALCAVVFSSQADLRSKRDLEQLLLKYLPLLMAGVGAILWTGLLYSSEPFVVFLRQVLSALPVIGLLPACTAPFLALHSGPALPHLAMAVTTTIILVRKHRAWLAVHLEELAP